MPEQAPGTQSTLWRYALFGFVVAFAGPPIYIHLPKFYAEQHGVSLAIIGSLLLGLRTIDFVQDPLIAWLIAKWQGMRAALVSGFSALLGLSMWAIFAIDPLLSPSVWFAVCLVGIFTGFSGLQIIIYSSGVGLAEKLSQSHERIASWREAGVLGGICLACVVPTLFMYGGASDRLAYQYYAWAFIGLLVLAVICARPLWRGSGPPVQGQHFGRLLRDRSVVELLALGFVNALPTALTATLFLFFVEYRLEAPVHAGPMLLVFFLAAAFAAPFWGRAALFFGTKPVLVVGMTLAIASFGFASQLDAGDWRAFYVICIASGAAGAADMTLLPALLAARVAKLEAGAAEVFGLWGFINKSTLAVAAGVALPALAYAGFEPGQVNSNDAKEALTWGYAIVPCLLKLVAIGLLVVMMRRETAASD